jgi:hypothetical protein
MAQSKAPNREEPLMTFVTSHPASLPIYLWYEMQQAGLAPCSTARASAARSLRASRRSCAPPIHAIGREPGAITLGARLLGRLQTAAARGDRPSTSAPTRSAGAPAALAGKATAA